jgi:hypothetical protein
MVLTKEQPKNLRFRVGSLIFRTAAKGQNQLFDFAEPSIKGMFDM